MESITLKVGGMSCMGCVSSVKRLLEAMPGVLKVDVDLAKAEAAVDFDSKLTNLEAIKNGIVEGGYTTP
jgi:copper chaperone